MSFVDLFSEAGFTIQLFEQVTEASSAFNASDASGDIDSELGEHSFDIFSLIPGGGGTPPGLRFQGQMTSDFLTYQNVPGMQWDWLPSQGDGFGGHYGVRVANYRLPIVRHGGRAGSNANRLNTRRWVVTEIEADSGSWTLDRAFFSVHLHKGSISEHGSLFSGMPGAAGRLRLDWT